MADRIVLRRKDETPSPVAFEIEEGSWSDDGWIGRHLRLKLRHAGAAQKLAFKAYSSDMSLRLLGNRLTATVNGKSRSFDLKWGGLTDIELPLVPQAGNDVVLALSASGHMPGDQLDGRERSIIIKSMTLRA